jgi:hypothetical protein
MKTIIEMAREAGGLGFVHDAGDDPSKWQFMPKELEAFAALVLASADPQSSMAWQEGNEAGRLAEREACARVCESMRTYVDRHNAVIQSSATDCVAAIRARGQA